MHIVIQVNYTPFCNSVNLFYEIICPTIPLYANGAAKVWVLLCYLKKNFRYLQWQRKFLFVV